MDVETGFIVKNPWLNIPASDYEGHMDYPGVDQRTFLREAFREALSKYDCRSIAYLGCATGTGLEYIDNEKTESVTAIDIHPQYLQILHDRHANRIPNLKIIAADLNDYQTDDQPFSLVFAGLLFEYLEPLPLLNKISNWLEADGTLVVILQLPDTAIKKVSETPYASLKQLDPVMHLIPETDFRQLAEEAGLKEITGRTVTLKSGKSFYVGAFKK